MATPDLGDAIKDLLNSDTRRDSGSENSRADKTSDLLRPEEFDSIARYLEAPTREGYWRLSAQWKSSGAFSKALYDQVKDWLFKDALTKADGSPSKTPKGISKEEKRELITQITQSFSTSFSVFRLVLEDLVENEEGSKRSIANSPHEWMGQLNPKLLREGFPQALQAYRDGLYFDGIERLVPPNKPFKTATGLIVVLSWPRAAQNIIIASSNRNPLEAIMEMLSSCDQVTNAYIDRVFSPEEELFQPYFSFLSAAFEGLINDVRIKPQLVQAFDQFTHEDYVHCVGTLGLVGEDYLTQVYETLLRQPSPKGLTLGQIYDQLHAQIKDIFRPPREELKPLDRLYEDLKQIQGGDVQADPDKTSEAVLRVLRDTLTTIKSDRQFFNHRIDELHQRDQRISIFPPDIRDNINELTRYRNAAAHKTRVPLGNYEALRTLYCLTSFVMWWRRDKLMIDWMMDVPTTLRAAISRNQG